MNHFYKVITAISILAGSLAACKKDDAKPSTDGGAKATLSVQFDNICGDKNLQLNTGLYVNAAGEQFRVSMLKYYISNIRVKNTAGVEFVVPQDSSYFLVSESEAASQFVKVRVPEGEYN